MNSTAIIVSYLLFGVFYIAFVSAIVKHKEKAQGVKPAYIGPGAQIFADCIAVVLWPTFVASHLGIVLANFFFKSE